MGSTHVVADQLKAVFAQKMPDVVLAAGEKVVQAQHLMALPQQGFHQVGAYEASAAGDQDTVHY
jgi:hypothetical protein